MGTNSIHTESSVMGAPSRIHGLRRPQRVRVRSLSWPISGSVITSLMRASIMIVPTIASDSPRSRL